MDYVDFHTTLTFAPCQMRSCVDAVIVDDDVLEMMESFSITLERTTGLDDRIDLDPVDGVVQINDSDGVSLIVNNASCLHRALLQWLWLVWSRHSMLCQRTWGLLKCVLLSMNQVTSVQSHSLLKLCSQLVMAVQVYTHTI